MTYDDYDYGRGYFDGMVDEVNTNMVVAKRGSMYIGGDVNDEWTGAPILCEILPGTEYGLEKVKQ